MAACILRRVSHFFIYTRSIPWHLNSLRANDSQLRFQITKQYINNSSKVYYSDIVGIDEPTTSKKKKTFIPKITLLSEKNEMSIVTSEEAQKIARRQNLKLVKIVDFDTKSEREIYKLMKIRDYVEADAKYKSTMREANNRTIKDEKTISMSGKIFEHDLNTKIKSIHNMLRKRHGVRVVISVDGSKEKASEVANYIMEKSKDVAKVTLNTGGGYNVKVILRPVLEPPNIEETAENQDSSANNMK